MLFIIVDGEELFAVFGDEAFFCGGLNPCLQFIELAVCVEQADLAVVFGQLFEADGAEGEVGVFDARDVDDDGLVGFAADFVFEMGVVEVVDLHDLWCLPA